MPDPVWYMDPRWWGIAASASLGAISLFAQWRYRIGDKRQSRKGDEFDQDIGDPIRETFSAFRNLRTKIKMASNLRAGTERDEAFRKIRAEHVEEAMSPFSSSVSLADERLNNNGLFVRRAIEFEDSFHTMLAVVQHDFELNNRIKTKVSLLRYIDDLIINTTSDLQSAREKYIL